MTEVKNKIVNVESLSALHDYNENTFLKKNEALTTIGITATADELNKLEGVTSNIQTQLNNKHTTGNNVVVEKTNSPHISLNIADSEYSSKIYKNATVETGDFGTVICDFDANGERDAFIIRRNTSLDKKLLLKVQATDGTEVEEGSGFSENHYYIYGEHHKPTPDEIGALAINKVEEATCTLSSGWSLYDGSTPIYVNRYGKVVTMTGAVRNDNAITSSSDKTKMFAIPSGYRPKHELNFVCHGVGVMTWLMTVGTDGAVYVSRHGSNQFVDVEASKGWFTFSATWIAA